MTQTRRSFIQTALKAGAFVSFAANAPISLLRAATAAPQRERDTVLVVLQLSGGNDGLNTVIPFADDAYHRGRPTLRQMARGAHKLDSHLAFHPRMEGFYRLYRDGLLTIVQGVGYPDMDRNHPGGMHNWHTANPRSPKTQTGWLGRAADRLWKPGEANVPAMFVGAIPQPFASNAEQVVVPSVRSPREIVSQSLPSAERDAPAKLNQSWLDSLRRATAEVQANNRRIESATSTSVRADYPQLLLAEELRATAHLIRADLGVRIFFTELGGGNIGGFDNHAGQLGNHCSLAHQLSESVAAFIRDLQRDKLHERVLLMTFSEFGRSVHENGRRGTDHGAAQPVFLAGGRLKGGLCGAHPSLTDLDKDGLKFHTDFRRVYATALDRWLGLDSRGVLGAPFEPLDVFKA
ncbi:MAG: DUF1501 domain-containing protein [Verrucomicrobia bacterium]|nr:DUF1501 domain-containing protein [Verrucomicrobiota bacterium]